MQPRVIRPREDLTAATVERLIRDDAAITVGAGCEVIDRFLRVLSDITGDLAGGSITHSNYASLHNTASLQITSDLTWANAILRPYMTISNGIDTARFNLGAYFTSTPERITDIEPPTYDVQGYDILLPLSSLVGDSYAVQAGTTYLFAIEQILLAQGYTAYNIDKTRASTTLPTARSWPLDDKTTWLTIVNDLLAAIGYRGIYSNWDGRLIVENYVEPSKRPAEWTYDTGLTTSMLAPATKITRDFFETPNRWVGVRNNNIEASPPAPGNGIYEYQNTYDGETSIDQRDRVISRVMYFEAADQNALISQVMQAVANDKKIGKTFEASTSPNPLHWHFDRLAITHPEIGTTVQVTESQWTLPLNGDNMTHTWTVN